jgi:hypothetical protein
MDRKIKTIKLGWPIIYQMFCYLELYRNEILDSKFITEIADPKLIPNYLKMTPAKRALALLVWRGGDLRAKLHMLDAMNAAMSVNLYMRSVKVKGPFSALNDFYRNSSYPSALPEVLQRALQMDTKDDDWTVKLKQVGGRGKLKIYHKGDLMQDYMMDKNDLSWSRYSQIREDLFENQL